MKFIATRAASAIAARMDELVPPEFAVRAEGTTVGLVAGGAWSGGTDLRGWVTATSDREEVERAATAILEAIQDQLIRVTGRPWPPKNDGATDSIPSAQSRLAEHELLLWYGSETAPDLRLPPIPLAELASHD